jgi:carnitine O-acetyltransferase
VVISVSLSVLQVTSVSKLAVQGPKAHGGTLSQQDKLLRLPVPELTETIPKWLDTTKPHLSPAELEQTKKLAQSFIQEAQPLQDYLKQRMQQRDNWVNKIRH